MLTPEELLPTTRTVRKRLDFDRPVPLELVKHCVQVALQAPSGSNTQRWQWLVVTDAGQRAALGRIYGRACHEYLESPNTAGKQNTNDPTQTPEQKQDNDSDTNQADRMGDVPARVVPCLETAS